MCHPKGATVDDVYACCSKNIEQQDDGNYVCQSEDCVGTATQEWNDAFDKNGEIPANGTCPCIRWDVSFSEDPRPCKDDSNCCAGGYCDKKLERCRPICIANGKSCKGNPHSCCDVCVTKYKPWYKLKKKRVEYSYCKSQLGALKWYWWIVIGLVGFVVFIIAMVVLRSYIKNKTGTKGQKTIAREQVKLQKEQLELDRSKFERDLKKNK
jgi:hypothetical protein